MPPQTENSKEILTELLSRIDQGVIAIDWTGVISLYNPMAETLLEVPASKALSQPFLNLFRDDYLGFSLQKTLELRTLHEGIYTRIITPSHTEKDINIQTFISDERLFILATDITELRKLQLETFRNTRMKELGGMAAMLAHEIRNPLGGIKGYASLLHRDLKNQPETQQMAGYIIEGTDNLNKLVTHVLNYAHPFQTKIESVDLITLIEELQEHIKADQHYSDNIKLQLIASEPTLILPLDNPLIKSALLNLMVNAMQAMPTGGLLTVTIHQENEAAVIKIIDSGIGIAPENLKKIFTAFFTTKPSGNGFGLLEVYKAIQAHNGTIEVTSTLNEGTTFTIKIPLKR